MKKIISIFLCLCLIISAICLVGCGDKKDTKEETAESTIATVESVIDSETVLEPSSEIEVTTYETVVELDEDFDVVIGVGGTADDAGTVVPADGNVNPEGTFCDVWG